VSWRALFLLFEGLFAHYDSEYRNNRQQCLSILKQFGFGQLVMETRILIEVEEMINKIRKQQGRPFDPEHLTTSCVANIIINMLFGRRYDHTDPVFQQLMTDYNDYARNFAFLFEIFPLLRFTLYFRRHVASAVKGAESIFRFLLSNTATCTKVYNFIFISQHVVQFFNTNAGYLTQCHNYKPIHV